MLCLALALAASPDVLDVDPVNGPFFEIRTAVGAATSGDVIRAAPGNYGFFGVFDKSLRVVPRDEVGSVNVFGTVRVQSIAAGGEVFLQGLTILVQSDFESAVVVAGCDGAVRFEDCAATSVEWIGASIDDSEDVTFVASTLRGGCGPTFFAGECSAHPGLDVEASSVTLWNSTIRGGWPTQWGAWGPPGVDAEASDVFVHGGRVEGGPGGPACFTSLQGCTHDAGSGGPAILASHSTVRRRGAELVGGGPGDPLFCAPGQPGPPFNGVGGSTLIEFDGVAPTLTLDAPWVAAGVTLGLVADGAPGETILLVVGPATGRVDLPAYVGDLHVGGPLGAARRVLLGTAPAQLQLQAPGLQPSESIQWTLQTVHLIPGGDVVFGPARAFTVLGS